MYVHKKIELSDSGEKMKSSSGDETSTPYESRLVIPSTLLLSDFQGGKYHDTALIKWEHAGYCVGKCSKLVLCRRCEPVEAIETDECESESELMEVGESDECESEPMNIDV